MHFTISRSMFRYGIRVSRLIIKLCYVSDGSLVRNTCSIQGKWEYILLLEEIYQSACLTVQNNECCKNKTRETY